MYKSRLDRTLARQCLATAGVKGVSGVKYEDYKQYRPYAILMIVVGLILLGLHHWVYAKMMGKVFSLLVWIVPAFIALGIGALFDPRLLRAADVRNCPLHLKVLCWLLLILGVCAGVAMGQFLYGILNSSTR